MLDDFDDFNDKVLYSSATNHIRNANDFPFDKEFCDEIVNKSIEDDDDDEEEENLSNENQLLTNSTKTIEYDPHFAKTICHELGLNDPQTSRKNAWGNLSYAELIGKAILNSSQQRLTLSQIYSWIILYVPYFRDKSDKKSSQGWKNSIRHNLSLHNRFVRIPNEIAGKSSWWTIDFRAKQNRQRKKTQSNENKKKDSSSQLFTSVRDLNQSFYSNLQYQTDCSTQQDHFILHQMLKLSPLQTSNEENDEDCKITNGHVRRMIFKLMNVQMTRDQTLSTPPPPTLSNHHEQHFNSTFDFDIPTILDFQTTNHHETIL